MITHPPIRAVEHLAALRLNHTALGHRFEYVSSSRTSRQYILRQRCRLCCKLCITWRTADKQCMSTDVLDPCPAAGMNRQQVNELYHSIRCAKQSYVQLYNHAFQTQTFEALEGQLSAHRHRVFQLARRYGRTPQQMVALCHRLDLFTRNNTPRKNTEFWVHDILVLAPLRAGVA